jgi:serine/threonine protein kinase
MRAPNERGTGPGGAPNPPSGSERVPTTPRSGTDPRQAVDGSLPPGTMLGKYQIIRMLGQGGMGAVFEAVHTGIGKAVAIKTMNPALATDPRSEERFLREAEAASRLEHPHVVGVTDFGTDQGIIYLVMELLRGEDLAGVIGRAPAGLESAFTVDVMMAVCAGVFAAHETGLVHRDLKPQNIFLCQTPLGELVPKVLDFGISKLVNHNAAHSLTNSGSVMGTTHYLSPEQVQGAPLDGRSDEYALGVILYECLTARRPHDGDTLYAIMRSISEGRFAPPRALRPDLSLELESVVLRAMAVRADDRYPSVHAMGRALLPLASPKGRVVWGDYFSRPLGPVGQPSGSRRIYAAPTAPATVFAARGTPSDVKPISVIRTNELTRRQGLRWWQAGLGAVGLGLAAAAYMTFGPPRSLLNNSDGSKQPSVVGAPSVSHEGSPAAAAPPPAARRTPPAEEREAARQVPAPAADNQAVPVTPPAAAPRAAAPSAPSERPAASAFGEEAPPAGSTPSRKVGASTEVGARDLARQTRTLPPPVVRPKPRATRRADPVYVPPRDPGRRTPRTDDEVPPPSPLKGPGGAPILD